MLPYTSYLDQNFYINLLAKKYQVEFWDVSRTINYNSNYTDIKKKICFYKKFNEKKNLKDEIINNKNNVFINLLTYDYNTFWLHRFLKKNNCYLVYFNWGPSPKIEKKSIDIFSKINIYDVFFYVKYKLIFILYFLSFKFKFIKKNDIEFAA